MRRERALLTLREYCNAEGLGRQGGLWLIVTLSFLAVAVTAAALDSQAWGLGGSLSHGRSSVNVN